MLGILLAVVFFACVALVGVELSRAVCSGVAPLDGAPPTSEPPTLVLTVGAAFVGALFVVRGAPSLELGLSAVVVLALVASWSSDSLRGIVPDVFTLIPLGVLLLVALVRRDWLVLVSAAIAFVPFAVAALTTNGRGMGWGDVKLVALAGAALGAPLAILAMVIACIAAVIGYRIKGFKGGPIAFAPYIAAAVGLALPFGVGR